jgi:hypothetical protein
MKAYLAVSALPLMVLAGCGWASHPAQPADVIFAADALDGYLPADAGAVYTLNQRKALDAPAGRRLLVPLGRLLEKESTYQSWLGSLDADPIKDVDWAQFVISAPELNQPLVLLRGRFDAGRFRVGPGKLQSATEGRFRFYQKTDPRTRQTANLAQAGETLVVSDSKPRFLAALSHAADAGPVRLQDDRLRELLRQVDQRQCLWLAVSFDKLGPIPRVNNFALELVARPILVHAESVYGGVTCDDDVRAEFVFTARGDADAADLETAIKSSCQVAQGAYLLPGVEREMLPLLRLVGTGATSRDGRTVVLRCRLPADGL